MSDVGSFYLEVVSFRQSDNTVAIVWCEVLLIVMSEINNIDI